MEPRFQTSFIPKKPIFTDSQSGKHSLNLFAVIAGAIFILSLALSGIAYGYKNLLENSIKKYDLDLSNVANKAFEPELIKEIVRLDNRINVSKTLLESHIAVSGFFDLLEKSTLKTVRFKEFVFNFLGKDKVIVQMKGQARDFTSVALQADKFNENPMFKNTVMENLNLEGFGTVSFDVVTQVDPSVVMYSKTLNENQTVLTGLETLQNNQETNTNQIASSSVDQILKGLIPSGQSNQSQSTTSKDINIDELDVIPADFLNNKTQ